MGTACLLLLGACSSERGESETTTSTGATSSTGATITAAVTTTEADPCAVTLEATDVGITADSITIEVIADTGSPMIPGLARGSVEAVQAWADKINGEGGLGCRTVEVRTFDSKMDPNETRSGMIDACQSAFAMVGNTTLAVGDMSPVAECVDGSGNPTGLPDINWTGISDVAACNETSFWAMGGQHSCPPAQGERTFNATTVYGDYIREQIGGDAHGFFILPGSTPGLTAAVMPFIQQMRMQGLSGPAIGVLGSNPQSAYTPIVADMEASGAQFVWDSADPSSFLLLQREAAAQGVDIPNWFCGNCYDPDYVAGAGDLASGLHVMVSVLPYEEADINESLGTYVSAVPTRDLFSMGSWLAALLFQQAVEDVVDQYGPNGLTRESLLRALEGIHDFDGGGIEGPVDPSQQVPPNCMVVLSLNEAGEYERLYPEQPGTFACGDIVQITLDPMAAMSQEN